MKMLQTPLQHGSVLLLLDVKPHLDFQGRRDAQDIAVIGGMVEVAQGQAVGDDGLSSRTAVRQDVGGFEEFLVL